MAVSALAVKPHQAHHGAMTGKENSATAMMHSIHRHLVCPRAIVHHLDELHLSAEQEAYIKQQIQDTEATLSGLKWDLQKEIQHLSSLIDEEQINETQAITQLGKVLDLEHSIKKTRFQLMLRIKNKLTPEQLQTLQQMKKMRSHRHDPDHPGKHGKCSGQCGHGCSGKDAADSEQ
jgi:Spy/CpxP family protein refolding chaperone